MNHFELLNITLNFELDLSALEAAYFKAQRESHPDRFVGKSAVERAAAMQRSVDINEAYNTLKIPFTRAQHLLHLRGIEVGGDHDTVKPSENLLTKTMEWHEAIEEAEGTQDLEALDKSLKQLYAYTLDKISKAYKESTWEIMAQETLKLQFLAIAQHKLDIRTQTRKRQA